MNPAALPLREQFALFTENDFVDWLSRGLKAFYLRRDVASTNHLDPLLSATHDELSFRPFDFASHLIGRNDSLIDDLEALYDKYVPDDRKILFRLSIGNLLRQCVLDKHFPEPAVSDLIYLLANVRAYESLESLSPVIGRGVYGQERQWLQYEAIAVFKALLPSKEAVNGLRNFATLPNFCAGYSLDVLGALCRHDPENWFDAFLLMRGHIAELHSQAQNIGINAVSDFEEGVRKFVRSFARFMPTNEIADQIPRFTISGYSMNPYSSGAWLIEELFIVDGAPFDHLDEEGFISDDFAYVNVRIVLAGQPSRTSTISWDIEQYRAYLALKADVNRVRARTEARLSGVAPSNPFRIGVMRKLPYMLSGDVCYSPVAAASVPSCAMPDTV
jgi:hypothetical protein